MKGKIKRSIFATLMCCLLTVGSLLPTVAAEPFEDIGDATPSDTDYTVELQGVQNGFMYNKKPVKMEEGKHFFLVYTVEKVESNGLWQNGIATTQNAQKEYVFEDGTMHYDFSADMLFEPGSTYFFRYEMTAEGLSYVGAKVNKAGEASYLELQLPNGEKYQDCKYFGLWMGGTGGDGRITATLSQVLCYDEKGNDLGVMVNTPSGGASVSNYDLLKELNVQHSYEFSLSNLTEVAISNERGTDAETVFMSYTVQNVQKNMCNQTGGILSNSPTEQFPHANGILNYTGCDESGSPLLREGSHYLVRFDRNGGELKVMVKETKKNGTVSYFGFPVYYGEHKSGSQFFSLWFGEGNTRFISADFVDFKCYDAKGKNLGVQLNHKDITIRHIGNLEDYTLCEGVYYALENDTFVILDDECNIGRRIDKEGQDTVWGTYVVNQDKLIMTMEGQEEVFEYFYDFMNDKDGVKYLRLKDQRVTFVTGEKDNEGNQTVTVTAEDGYKLEAPEEPSRKNLTFKEWCLGDGTAYDFDSVVTKTMTLYAKYTDGDGNEYLAVNAEKAGIPATTIVTVAGSAILIAVAVVCCMLIGKKGKKDGSGKQ